MNEWSWFVLGSVGCGGLVRARSAEG